MVDIEKIDEFETSTIPSRKFVLVKFNGDFCAIEDKYINSDGCINTPLCGPALHTAKSANKCMEYTQLSCEVDELVEKGIDSLVATVMVVGDVNEQTAREMLANVHLF